LKHHRRTGSKLGFVNRGDPSSAIFLVLLLLVVFQALGGHQIPPTKDIITVLVSFIISVSIHEFSHAYSAWKLGDSTAKDLGRLTLNPVAHFDPFGFFGFVMISLGYSFIGWGRPVPVNMNYFHGGIDQKRRKMALVALAGPISNIVQATAVAIPLRWGNTGGLEYYLQIYFYVNALQAAFNMIPIPPLDGSKVLMGILPNFWYPILAPLQQYGFMILFAIFFLGDRLSGSGETIASSMYSPLYNLLYRTLLT
jgi:Zn-dependent protease